MPRENRLWEWLREGTRGMEKLHLCRVENSAGMGTPDVEGCFDGRSFHLELKSCDRGPDGRLDGLEVRREQVLWLRRRSMCGGKCFLLVSVGKGRDKRIYMITGELAGEVALATHERQLVAATPLWLIVNCDAKSVILAAASLHFEVQHR